MDLHRYVGFALSLTAYLKSLKVNNRWTDRFGSLLLTVDDYTTLSVPNQLVSAKFKSTTAAYMFQPGTTVLAKVFIRFVKGPIRVNHTSFSESTG